VQKVTRMRTRNGHINLTISTQMLAKRNHIY